jgi:predicted nucleic acid-binding protein
MIAIDSSVIIAALLSWHEFHERAFTALEAAGSRKRLLIPLPALVESYSVMTRLPSPHRLAPAVAYQLLYESFKDARVAALSSRKAWPFIAQCVRAMTVGGRVYDAAIVSAAIESKASELLTLNPRDFEPFRDRITILVP